MDPTARHKLKELIRSEGIGLMDDPQRVKALLLDICPEARMEISLLVTAAEDEIPSRLMRSSDSVFREGEMARAVADLQQYRRFDRDAAEWIVGSWAWALGLTEDEPIDGSPSEREPAAATDPLGAGVGVGDPNSLGGFSDPASSFGAGSRTPTSEPAAPTWGAPPGPTQTFWTGGAPVPGPEAVRPGETGWLPPDRSGNPMGGYPQPIASPPPQRPMRRRIAIIAVASVALLVSFSGALALASYRGFPGASASPAASHSSSSPAPAPTITTPRPTSPDPSPSDSDSPSPEDTDPPEPPDPPSATFGAVSLQHNTVLGGRRGMGISFPLEVNNARGTAIQVCAYFAFASNREQVNAVSPAFDRGGKLAACLVQTPEYVGTKWARFQLFLPYDQLIGPSGTVVNLLTKAQVEIGTNVIGASAEEGFTYTIG